MFTASHPVSKEDFDNYYALRYTVLRKPWGQSLGSEKDEQEDSSIHAFIKHNNEVLAVCRLQFIPIDFGAPQTGQIRYMGVRADHQGKGLGKIILSFLENEAKELGVKEIILHARENALEFYKSCGYSITEKSYLMWGEIQHYLMKKNLS
ncbi:MAG: GNAT family N-acetyltransferase [Bacteroidota bacterium]|nr:GNAT family N-acetyltransferase [Bacteroidota bacterium]